MNVIVTGAAGFIGSRLSLRLLENGCRVADCVVSWNTGDGIVAALR